MPSRGSIAARDLLRTRHLRHAIVPHERRRLDPRHARRCEPVDELGADSRSEHVRLVLEPIARPDVTDRYAHASSLTDPDNRRRRGKAAPLTTVGTKQRALEVQPM